MATCSSAAAWQAVRATTDKPSLYRPNLRVPRGDDNSSVASEVVTMFSPPSSVKNCWSTGAEVQYARVDAIVPMDNVLPLIRYPPDARLQSTRAATFPSSVSTSVNRLGSSIVRSEPSAPTIDRRCQTAFVSMASEAIGAEATLDGPVVGALQATREKAAMSEVRRRTRRVTNVIEAPGLNMRREISAAFTAASLTPRLIHRSRCIHGGRLSLPEDTSGCRVICAGRNIAPAQVGKDDLPDATHSNAARPRQRRIALTS